MRIAFIIFSVLLCFGLNAQTTSDYPQGYFRNPLDIPIKLAGNFAECRPNHFHTGLDLKTNEQENMKVYAAAEGYVSRISISYSGYGNAIYITHPNGYTTVYGHLNDFFPELQAYIVKQQYTAESWNLDINVKPQQFPVKKGQFIAYSGTTGGSTGPHLHFEIRDTKTQHVLNAALFGFDINDKMPPVPKSIAVYNGASVYMQSPRIFPVKKAGNSFIIADTIVCNDATRFAVKADDYMNESPNPLGVFQMDLYLDETLQSSWKLNDINFDENRYVNAFADFKLKEENKGWYQTLFKTKGNKLSNYTYLNPQNGAIVLKDQNLHTVRISVKDVMGNQSDLKFQIRNNKNVSPGSVCNKQWTAGQQQEINSPTLKFRLAADALYDDVCADYTEVKKSKGISNEVQILNTKIPIESTASLSIKLNKALPSTLTGKLVFIHHVKAASLPGNNPQDAAAASYEGGWAKATIRTFGSYYAAIDTIAPSIKPLQKAGNLAKSKSIKFTVKDNLTSVTSFKATLDGKWLRFVRAGNTYTYTFDEYCPSGKHSLVISATDENNNHRNLIFTFIR